MFVKTFSFQILHFALKDVNAIVALDCNTFNIDNKAVESSTVP